MVLAIAPAPEPTRWERFRAFLSPIIVALIAVASALAGAWVSNSGNHLSFEEQAAAVAFAGNPTPAELVDRLEVLHALYPDTLTSWQGPLRNLQGLRSLWINDNEARYAFFQAELPTLKCPSAVLALWQQLFGPRAVGAAGVGQFAQDVAIAQCPAGSPSTSP